MTLTRKQLTSVGLLSDALAPTVVRFTRVRRAVQVLFTCPHAVWLIGVSDGGEWWHEGAAFEPPLPEGLGDAVPGRKRAGVS